MQEFSFSTRIFFGQNALARLRAVQNKRVLIVTDNFIYSSGIVKRIEGYLTDCRISYFKDVVPDPSIEVICAGVNTLLESETEVVVAVGGGSSLDAAKAIRNMAEQLYGEKIHITECFAIPTTSGTGSEVTEFAVITDKEKQAKYPLRDVQLRPTTAILDPSLVVSVPPQVTADTGMDVLTHAIEAYVSTGANDFSDAMAEKAVTLVMKFLPVAYRDGSDMLAREKLHNASCMAGLAFNSAGLGLNHGIAHGMGAYLHLPHGRANAILLPHIIEYNANLHDCRNGIFSTAAKKYQRLARIVDLPATNAIIGIDQLRGAVLRLKQTLNIADIKAGALPPATKEAIAESALNDVTTVTNPRAPIKRDILDILDKCCG